MNRGPAGDLHYDISQGSNILIGNHKIVVILGQDDSFVYNTSRTYIELRLSGGQNKHWLPRGIHISSLQRSLISTPQASRQTR